MNAPASWWGNPVFRVARLRWGNFVRRHRAALLIAAILSLIICIWLVQQPLTARVLGFLARHPFLTGLGVAVAFQSLVARRSERIYAERARSWLAALPVSLLPGWRITLISSLQLLFVLAGAALLALGSGVPVGEARTLDLACIVGASLGGLIGWAGSRRASGSTRSSHYAAVRRVRVRWSDTPALTPLSYWSVAQARAFTRPKIAARFLAFVLLAIPMGVSGAAALAVAVGAWLGLNLFMLSAAATRVAFQAAWWLAPTGLRSPRFAGAMAWRTLLHQLVTGALGALLIEATQPARAARRALLLLLLYLASSSLVTLAVCAYAAWAVGRARLFRLESSERNS